METTPKPLFWNEMGRIGCADLTPYPGSDTWFWNEWRAITDAELRDYERAVVRAARCETCAANRAPLALISRSASARSCA